MDSGEFSDLDDEVKSKLIKAAEWRSCNLDVDIIEEFDKHAFEDFCNCEAMDKEMKVSNVCI